MLALASPMSCAVAMCLFPAVFRGCQRRRGAAAAISAACAGSMECLQRRFLPLSDPWWLGLFRAHPTPPSPMRASDIGEMGIGTCLTHAVLVSNSWRPTCRVLYRCFLGPLGFLGSPSLPMKDRGAIFHGLFCSLRAFAEFETIHLACAAIRSGCPESAQGL